MFLEKILFDVSGQLQLYWKSVFEFGGNIVHAEAVGQLLQAGKVLIGRSPHQMAFFGTEYKISTHSPPHRSVGRGQVFKKRFPGASALEHRLALVDTERQIVKCTRIAYGKRRATTSSFQQFRHNGVRLSYSFLPFLSRIETQPDSPPHHPEPGGSCLSFPTAPSRILTPPDRAQSRVCGDRIAGFFQLEWQHCLNYHAPHLGGSTCAGAIENALHIRA